MRTQRAAAGIGGFAVLAAAITTSILVVGGAEPAGASDLARFASCDEMRSWVDDVRTEQFGDDDLAASEELRAGSDDAGAGAAPTAAPDVADSGERAEQAAEPAADGIGGGDADTGGTNTVVEGVDEIDVVDRLPGGRALVARNGTLSLVELDGLTLLDTQGGVPHDARISVGGDVVWVAGSAEGGSGVVVQRLRLGDESITTDGTWRTPGWLLDARRTGDRLHVLAVDEPYREGSIPFEDGPVPCDQVWRPEAGADTPAATLLATLPAEGALAPTATAEVVGSGAGFLVTGTAAYVTTQTWQTTAETGVHRFDLATLTPTGSGTVPGTVPGPFGINEHDGHLRVATSAQPQFRDGVDMPEPGIAVEDVDVAGDDAAVRSMPAPRPTEAGPLAEVFVLDLDGSLDLVGRTGRFGHDGETIHGVRFVGDVGYVVTFLQTDPFWILDLSDPTSPKTVGELEVPGFSGYLHPIDDTRVVGFGPDGEGNVAARLFDVSDHTAPSVIDELALGSDSPVVWDHHAYVTVDDERFAVPVNEHPVYVGERCDGRPVPLPTPVPEPLPEPLPVEPDGGDGSTGDEPLPVEPDGGDGVSGTEPAIAPDRPDGPVCEPIVEGGSSGVVVLAVRDGRLARTDERSVASDGSFMTERVLPTPDGQWVLVGWDRLVNPDGGELVLPT